MLPNKIIKIFTEVTNFFTSSEKANSRTVELYRSIGLEKIGIMPKKHHLQLYQPRELFLLLLLFPLFSVKNIKGYLESSLKPYMDAEKDTLYRFKNDGLINWRGILYTVVKKLLAHVKEKGTSDDDSPRCLIIDDSDLPKTGFKIEHVSKIFLHVLHKRILDFKFLLLGYWDSKSFTGVDFSFHKEKCTITDPLNPSKL